MHGGECPEGVVVVHEGIDIDDTIFFKMIAQMSPVVILQGLEPSCLLGLGITAREHTEAVRLGIVGCEHLECRSHEPRMNKVLTR